MRLLSANADIAEPTEILGVGETKPAKGPDKIAELCIAYNATKEELERIAAFVGTSARTSILWHFVEGNLPADRRGGISDAFVMSGALKSLDAAYWNKAMQATDVYDVMPQKRRDEWNEAVQKMTCPPFEEKTVRDTLAELLASRAKFFSERVDGVFRALSGEHVTNRPEGFGKRFIMNYMLHYGDMVNHSKAGYLDDLRCVIARFMKRDECKHGMSDTVINICKRRYGQWVEIDGGALKIRVYKKGTAHMEVHPDMAWRLNTVLASLYPKAIPAQFRKRVERKTRAVDLIQRPLPFAVIEMLRALEQAYRYVKQETSRENGWRENRREAIKNCFAVRGYSVDPKPTPKQIQQEFREVLESLGGVFVKEDGWQFDYDPRSVLDTVVASGCVPDDRAHQHYPTQDLRLQKAALRRLKLEDHHEILEPSAGLGHLAELLPKDRTICVEVSELRANVLAAKGYKVICMDFLAWAQNGKSTPVFDRVLMNPPFDAGRWHAHLDAAAHLLKPGGRLVAILPIGAKKRTDLLPQPEFRWWWKRSYKNAFAGASIEVVILVVKRKK